MTLRGIWNAAEKDLRRQLRDPFALALWLGIPLMIGTLISLVMGGSNPAPPTARLLVADEDDGMLSGLLARAFAQEGQGRFLQVEEVDQAAGRERIGRGDGTALLVIPPGFGDAVLHERPARLLLVTNPAQRILPRIVEEGLEILADGTFYVHRVMGPELREIIQGPPGQETTFSNTDVARISVAFNEVIQRLQKYLFPPVIDVEVPANPAAPPERASAAKMWFPGIVFMALMFMAEGLSGDVWRERDQATLRRAACAPSGIATVLVGKLLANGLVLLLSLLVVMTAGMLYVGLPLTKLPLALGWSLLAGIVLLMLFIAIQLHVSTQRAASVLTNSLFMPLMFVGGSFFPFEMMPAWMATIGRWTPNGWALQHLKDILAGRAGAMSTATAVAALLIVMMMLFLVSERRMRRVFARG